MVLDVPTTVVSALLTGVVLSAYFWVLVPGSGPWVRYWALGNSAITLGVGLFVFGGPSEGFFLTLLANLGLLGGYLWLEVGVRQFAGRPLPRWLPFVHLGTILVLFPVFSLVWDSYEIRTWVHNALAISVLVRIILLLVIHIPGIRRGHRLLVDGFATTLGILALIYFVRGFLILGQGIESNLDQNTPTAVIFVGGQLVLLLWSLGFTTLSHLRTQAELEVTIGSRDRMFSMVAHDLKGPVGNVALMLQSMVDNGECHEESAEFLSVTANAAQESYRLLENLLDWARTQQGGLRLSIQRLSLAELLETTLEPLRPQAAVKAQTLTVATNPGLFVAGDQGTLSAVFRNLVSNAIKFSPNSGIVSVASHKEGHWVVVEVHDSGPGFPPALVATVDRGGMPESTRGTEGEKGTGLGLSLCREFATLNGGTVTLVPAGPGGGGQVTVRLPLG